MTGADMLILTAMSYDRYVAICNPLHYPMVMNNIVCVLLAVFSWLLSSLDNAIPLFFWSHISCFTTNIINHFFCDLVPLMELSCDDKSALESLVLIEGTPIVLIPFFLTFMSYIFIIATILRIRSSTGRRKAFYTCSSHLTVVSLFYVSLSFVYLSPTTMNSLTFKKISSLFNSVVVPLLNPLIYSLKNKEMKSALKRQFRFIW
ncbi:olfactory receptor-like protein OLF1 [Bombina bombina]|uniref:olfactory receptor-like protein OLF1 n=1 Tax=Bombina bombina TaxID=8345 RepID=UPI00235A73B5|nr:olfactory receptor-like protein OLF1 [Bombina bombina]